ncbi:MAG: hypothetical protein WBH85_19530 [Thermoanaerobaculia bacterium]
MMKTILVGKGNEIEEMPQTTWEEQLALVPEQQVARLGFMTDEHHAVRYFVVRELTRQGRPLEPALIADRLDLPEPRVVEILDELEKNLLFLVRNDNGAVSWAFPVTVDRTPHRLSFSTGERLYGA